jgi:hypothetical protein
MYGRCRQLKSALADFDKALNITQQVLASTVHTPLYGWAVVVAHSVYTAPHDVVWCRAHRGSAAPAGAYEAPLSDTLIEQGRRWGVT